MTIEDIIKSLEKDLKHKRFVHSIGVAYTAANLAMCYKYDINKAFKAGLLHDCAKYLSDSESFDYCKKNNIIITDSEKLTPALLHAKTGAFMAKTKYKEDDLEILDAIRWHTTGRAAMALYEKIIFVADYIEPNRAHDDKLPLIRELAYSNLDKCISIIYEDTINYINGSNKKMDPTTIEAYKYYKNVIGE